MTNSLWTAYTQTPKLVIDSCCYQPPPLPWSVANKNAEAILNYPNCLKSLAEKDKIIQTSERENSNLKTAFLLESDIERRKHQKETDELKKSLQSESSKKNIYKGSAAVLAIITIIKVFAK